MKATHLVDRKVLVSMVFIAITMLGIVSYRQLQVELLPNTEYPVLFVQVVAPSETDPRYVEQQGIVPLEGVISTLEGVEKIESRVSPGGGAISVFLKKDANITYSYLKLVEKVERNDNGLPDDFTAMVMKVDLAQITNQFMRIQVRGEGGVDRVRSVVEQKLKERFENISGIAAVEVYGGRQKSVEIILNDQLLESYGLTLGAVRQKISSQQARRQFVGEVKEGATDLFVTVEADYTSLDDLRNIVLKPEGPIRLKDVAEVYFGAKEEDSYSRVNGKDAVTMTLSRESKVNLIALANKVNAEIETINKEFEPQGIELVVEFNSAETMQTNIDKIISLALIGGLLAVFLLWIFLQNITMVFVAMVAIPVSVFSAFNFFYAADVSINILTLIGLALAVGMLIDNNVVVMENVHRLIAKKKGLREGVISGTSQVWRSITASTLTTICVFLPFVFASNVLFREVAKHISVSIVSTLLISLVTALVLVPVLTLAFLRRKRTVDTSAFEYLGLHNKIVQLYIQLLKASLRHPLRTIFGAITLFFVAVFISLAFSMSSKEEAETTEFYLTAEMPAGSTLEATDKVVRELETRFAEIPEKPDVITQVYAERASFTVRLDKEYRKTSKRQIGEVRQEVLKHTEGFDNVEISMSQGGETSGGGGGGMVDNPGDELSGLFGLGSQREHIVVKGEDFDKMLLVANDVQYYLKNNIENLQQVSISASSARPEIHLDFDPLLMGLYGITPANVAAELFAFRQEIPSGGTLKVGAEDYEIILKTKTPAISTEVEKKRMADLEKLQVQSSNGGVVPLKDVSDINYASGRSEIRRVNQEKEIVVIFSFSDEVNNSNELLANARAEVENLIAKVPLPSGVSAKLSPEENPFDEFKFLGLIALLLIFMILASVFESFTAPFVMMFTVPLAAIGSLLALIFTGTSLLSLNTLIGFLILLGIVVNNGILLMDYAQQLRRNGMGHARALIEAGISRIRPVTITAATTIIAMIPLAMGKSEYVGSLGAPFAITVVGGLGLSTVLTLVFIPTFSFGLESALTWIRGQHRLILAGMIVGWVLGFYYTWFSADIAFAWKLLYTVLFVVGIPGIAWFVLNSLRQANSRMSVDVSQMRIEVRNLVKVYDRDNRFTREWKMRRKITGAIKPEWTLRKVFDESLWQVPLLLFGAYFTWFYVENPVPEFFTTLLMYIMIPLYFTVGAGSGWLELYSSQRWIRFLQPKIAFAYKWGFPLMACIIFYFSWDSLFGAIFLMVLWYMGLFILYSGNKLKQGMINPTRIEGRMAGLRRGYYLAVRAIPYVGQQKNPFKALKGVSLDMRTGMIGLLGPNGAGKTTLMRIICGVLDQSYGKLFINGIDTQEKREELQGLIGYLPQEFGMYENLTAEAFLDYQAILKGIIDRETRSQRIEYVLKAVHMWERRQEPIGSYSGGMKQRIGIAMILLHLPKILVVDEPTAGLDPSERIRFRNLLVELSSERIVLFSTHIIEDISSSCNHVAVMYRGDLKYWGQPVDMVRMANGKVWQAEVDEVEFARINALYKVVHHVRVNGKIRCRCLADEQPFESAVGVTPVLEDAYLLLLR